MSTSKEWKEKGNALVKEKKYSEALECYTKAIEIDPSDPILYSNRAAMYQNLSQFQEMLNDAEKALSLNPKYIKGFLRKGKALECLLRQEEAVEVYKEGLKIEENNEQLKEALQSIENQMKNPFTKNYKNLFTDPRTSKLMQDPQFKNIVDLAMHDQKFLIQMLGDPRFKDVMSVLTGIDLDKISREHEEMEKKRKEEEAKKKKEEEEKKKKEEEERKKKEEEEKYNNMTEEEKKDVDDHKKADEIKLKGNDCYRQKNYTEAIKFYEEAIKIYPKEMIYYLNSAKCYMELKNYEKAIELSKHVAENCFDFQRRATAFGIIGYANKSLNKLEEAIKAFQDSQLESPDNRIKEAEKETIKLKQKQDEEAYINPEKAEEANEEAKVLYKDGKFPQALKFYTEAIKRNPKLPKYYTNRAYCHIKLMEFYEAIKDCDKALEIEPKTIKAYQIKANCHIITKEYHKALQNIEQGRKFFPDDEELKNYYNKVMIAIQCGNEEDDKERRMKAAADPEIQALLKDPRIQQLFKDFQENPKSAQEAVMKDPWIREAFSKLVAAGIVKTK